MTTQAFNLDVATKVALFDPKETVFIDISDATAKGLTLKGVFLKSKNLVVLCAKAKITEKLEIDLTTTENVNDTNILKTIGVPTGVTEEKHVTDGIAKVVNYLKSTVSTDLTIYFPQISGTTIDNRLIMKDPTTQMGNIVVTNKSTSSLDDLLIPGGNSLLIVVPKNSPNVNIVLTRSSYLDKVCPAQSNCPTCPVQLPCPDHKYAVSCDEQCADNSSSYVVATWILAFFLFVFVVCNIYCCFKYWPELSERSRPSF
ncbi:hypothetical protein YASMINEVIRUS_528 [Yasminevirus sp. GU-2018]|uniref:Uncharacterized protein n=1 Tax=Yasminevirus sp. GU-2018 TaxID=2420051 RepID=A0A5K0U8D2_9VIRU|nr:hypothetical protein YASMINEVIRUS_528 [Yasminevirus sp. GU-2018]